MIPSIIILGVLFVFWAILVYTYELAFEVTIKPLTDLKRRLLVSMSKRKIESMKQKSNDLIEENNIEEDNKAMKYITKLKLKFHLKHLLMIIVLVIATICVILTSHLEASDIIVFLIAGLSVVFVIAKFVSTKEEVRQKAIEVMKSKLHISEKYLNMISISKDNKEE